MNDFRWEVVRSEDKDFTVGPLVRMSSSLSGELTAFPFDHFDPFFKFGKRLLPCDWLFNPRNGTYWRVLPVDGVLTLLPRVFGPRHKLP